MLRQSLILLIVLIFGVSLWLFQVSRNERQPKSLVQEVTQPMRTPRPSPKPVQEQRDREVQRRSQIQVDLEELKTQLGQERQRLEAQQSLLSSLQQRQRGENTAQRVEQIQESEQVRRFVDELRLYDGLEQEINQRADDLLREQSNSLQMVRSQIDENIRQQEEMIRQTEQQFYYWSLQGYDLTQQQAELESLGTLLRNQQEQLEAMKAQKLQVSLSTLGNEQSLFSEKRALLDSLQANKAEVRTEISSLRDEMAQREQRQIQSQSLTNEIGRTQQGLVRQREKVEVLERSVRRYEQELQLLR